MSTEKIHFKIGVSGTYWDKKPHFKILVDETEYVDASITKDSDTIEFIEFDCEVEEEVAHTLRIVLDNKEDSDVVKDNPDPDNYVIVNDMLLNLHSVEADDIDLGNLIQVVSTFKFNEPHDYPEPNSTEIPCCVNFGFNGTYELEFTSPFYLWLLEKL